MGYYKVWHQTKVHAFVHWFAFVFIAVLLTSMCVSAIDASAAIGAAV